MVQKNEAWRFEGLEAHRPCLVRFLRRRIDDENAVQDLVQDTLMRGARYRQRGMAAGRLRAWLLRIAQNLHSDALRKRSTEPTTGLEPDSFDELELRSPVGRELAWRGVVYAWDEMRDHLRHAVARLPQGDQIVLEGFYGGQVSTSELARTLGVRRALVKVRLFRARRKLREHMQQQLLGNVPGPTAWA